MSNINLGNCLIGNVPQFGDNDPIYAYIAKTDNYEAFLAYESQELSNICVYNLDTAAVITPTVIFGRIFGISAYAYLLPTKIMRLFTAQTLNTNILLSPGAGYNTQRCIILSNSNTVIPNFTQNSGLSSTAFFTKNTPFDITQPVVSDDIKSQYPYFLKRFFVRPTGSSFSGSFTWGNL